MRMTKEEFETYAEMMWQNFSSNEKTGVRFGLFPAAPMKLAEQETGLSPREISVALMDVAKKNGGMRV